MAAIRKVDIVVTTIFEPRWLPGYVENLRRYGRESQVTLRIICDRKTPQSVFLAARAAAEQGIQVDCPSLDEQSAYLKRLGFAEDFVPWNTDNRRNIGFLRAWESGAEVLVSIDDDNYCREDSDFVGEHCVVVGDPPVLVDGWVAEGGAWFNVCGLLESQVKDPIYPRGYPYAARSASSQAGLKALASRTEIAINAGLWLDDPDVDALTRLTQGPRVRGHAKKCVVLGRETWSPINTQNTAVRREAIPAYYYVRMGYPLRGMTIDRFGDILSGYFVQKCAKHLGHAVRIGGPVADHRRTPHNLFKDLYYELGGIVVVEDLLPWLQDLVLTGATYSESYESLAEALAGQAQRFRGFVWDDGGREFLAQTSANMQQWLKVVRTIG